MVTIAQGKFSKPRPNKHTDAEIAVQRASRKKVAADPIEKAEADIAKFMDTAMQESVAPTAPQMEQTQKVSDATGQWRNATRIAPEGFHEEVPQNWQDATQVVNTTDWHEATQVIPTRQTSAPAQEPARPQPPARPRPPVQPEPEEEYVEDMGFLAKYRKPILVGCSIAILLLVIAIIVMVVSLRNVDTDDGKILDNVIVAGVDIGGMTPDNAKIAIHNATSSSYSAKSMQVILPDSIIEFTPEDTGVTLDVDAVVEAAYNYGRVGTEQEIERAKAQALVGQYVMDLLPYLQLDAEYIHQALVEYANNFNSSYTSSSYSFSGNKPGLTADTYNETVPCQTLVLKIGTPGRNLDIENVYETVLKAYSSNTFQVDASHAPEEMPELPDLDEIFEDYCSTPVDAYMDMQTFEVTGEIYGYTFDLNAARELLASAEYGSTIEIPMEYLIPEVLSTDLTASLYADVLGTYQTEHTNNTNRNTNLSLACQAINGTILEPGEEFSFNDVVGERTEARGYRTAAAYADGETVSELGGGICQVSSTLYYSVLLADLEVTARQNHSYVSTYIPMGMDATVSWGGPEFKFRNSTSYPIRIEAEVSGGYVTVRIMGTDEKDYYVEMEYEVVGYLSPETEYEEFAYDNEEGYADGDVIEKGSTGYVVDTYKHKYDKETGEEISEEYVARSSYRPHNEVIAKVEPKPTEAPTEAPTQAPTEVPAATEAPVAETEAPAQTQAPAANDSPDVPDVDDPEP